MRATRTIHLGLFLLAGSVLTLEVALTRILSLMLWSHYTFLVISTAILGFGAAGSLLATRSGETDERRTRRLLASGSLAFATSVVAMIARSSLILDSLLPADPRGVSFSGAQGVNLSGALHRPRVP